MMTTTMTTTVEVAVKTVKAGRFPGRISEYAVPMNATVEDILGCAGIEVGNDQKIKCNGYEVEPTDVPADGSIVIVARQIKGNINL